MVIVIKVGIFFLNLIYDVIKLFPTQRKVTLISRQSNSPSIEFQMIKNEIERRDPRLEVILLCRTLDGGIASSVMTKLKYVLHMMTQMYHIATSSIVLLDSYCIAASVLKHKKGLIIIQMWHSMGTMKKFGYAILDMEEGSNRDIAEAMKMHENYDFVFASADTYKSHLAIGFHCSEEAVLTMPLPRADLLKCDAFAESMRKKIYAKYPELMDKPIILYCPTFRKDECNLKKAIDELISVVDLEKFHLVIKLHPNSHLELKGDMIQGKGFSSFDFLFVADYIISDYSCIVYEAAIRNLPLYFYNFDMTEYEKNRGLAIEYLQELPGVISGKANVILNAIENISYPMEDLKQFKKKYVKETEHATEDIVDFLQSLINR